MANMELSELIALMLAAGGPERQLARVRWPLHMALREMHEDAGRRGERRLVGVELEMRPSPEVGQEVVGADAALRALVRCRVLRPDGDRRFAHLALDPDAVVPMR